MEHKPTILWDFDGTLGYREGMFFGALYKVLNDFMPENKVKIDDIKPFLQQGFPWHNPEEGHCHLSDPNDWWSVLEDIFCKAYICVGIDRNKARELAVLAHNCYVDPKGFSLFEDTIETLSYFKKKGWENAIFSNHVPELVQIINSLGLEEYICRCISSANIGYEKPNAKAFYIALESLGNPQKVWMVGDSLNADIRGAEGVGIKAVLVRTDNKANVKYYSRDLKGVIDIISNDIT